MHQQQQVKYSRFTSHVQCQAVNKTDPNAQDRHGQSYRFNYYQLICQLLFLVELGSHSQTVSDNHFLLFIYLCFRRYDFFELFLPSSCPLFFGKNLNNLLPLIQLYQTPFIVLFIIVINSFQLCSIDLIFEICLPLLKKGLI